ncbi:hypothetical protein GN956_G3978 [Arapaima gigas]
MVGGGAPRTRRFPEAVGGAVPGCLSNCLPVSLGSHVAHRVLCPAYETSPGWMDGFLKLAFSNTSSTTATFLAQEKSCNSESFCSRFNLNRVTLSSLCFSFRLCQ